MPDSRASYDTPRSWDDAFAALPLEAPLADGWTSVARRLPDRQPRPRRRHRHYGFAVAAAVALAAVIPAFHWAGRETPRASDSVATMPRPSVSPAATPVAAANQPRSIHPESTPENSASSIPITATATAKTTPRIDTPPGAGKVSPVRPSDSGASMTAAAGGRDPLESLYAESARLEAVLAQLQEPRAESASAAALSAELEDRIAGIDGALSQPGVPSASQLDLWQQRVDALRQLTGVETTQRWMAAQGTATEGPLAQVY